MAIGVTAILKIKEGNNEEFEALFMEMQKLVVENEKGCHFYALHKSRADAQSYIVLEQYADEQALEEHRAAEYHTRIGAQLASFVAAAPEIELFDSV